MALINCDFFSEVLDISTSISVILPQNTIGQIGMKGSIKKEKYPVLYLLHGLSDDHTIWCRRTSIERYVADLGIAVVMPCGGRSYYTDMEHGYKYFTYITEELPQIVENFFPISEKREDNFIAGLSMGGYGALKAAFNCPDKYAAAASLSGAVDILERLKDSASMNSEEMHNIFGDFDKVKNSKNDLFYMASELSKSSGNKPKIYSCCGTEDFLYENNIKFRDHMKSLKFDYTYEEEGGTHEWGFWDKKIQSVLNWLPVNK
ncbi:esterase family protein [Clostridium sp. 19966]|uniref:alpha/beta hydrolase n=1 Tax=Clostridium sp. 19966 TaxID=2768166 RepID=UPI0028DFDE01|nr:alpha/beta hydrolase family protein [Clostridium sp. 19966]MDT8715533.1 esterase family protein [Clostridium sp. 19966]